MKRILMFALILGALTVGVTAYGSGSDTNSGATTESTLRYVTCYNCKGSGKCPSCGGVGAICINKHFNKWIDCVNCYNGSCTTCGGDGIITLP